MRVPLSWLRSHCDPGLPAAALAERLAVTGTEVERIERVGVGAPEAFVVGKVLDAEPHPDADRLSVCRVDDGSGEPRTIVCGAPNVAGGQTVAVARPGAVLPDGRALGEVRLRGVVSSGMILAEDEVGVGEDHEGIIVLPGELPAGSPLAEHLPIADEVLELDVTPNRPDCLGVYGVAREVHAVTDAELSSDPTEDDAEPAGSDAATDHAAVEIADPDVCLRFTARVFENVEIGPSPRWLRARLLAAGQRPISSVVDITNYVMLLTGQPMHAFDLDEVRGRRIVVRKAAAGERMTTLDGEERAFDPPMALVCDAEGPSSVAGIMGGRVSEVSEKTTRVLMEAATWVGSNILQTSARLGLRSEASGRFEKQLHPEQAMAAQRLAARLMVELCGARLVPGTVDAYPRPVEPRVLRLRTRRLHSLLGEPIPTEEAKAILARLGFGLVGAESGKGGDGRGAESDEACGDGARADHAEIEVTVPSFRDADVQREADVIEEVARVYGLDRLPITLPARARALGRLDPAQRLRRRLEDALRDRGALEVVAYSFTSREALARLRLGEAFLEIANPLSEDQRVMRPLLLPGLLDAAQRGAAHDVTPAALFESAHVYGREGSLAQADGASAGGGRPDGTPASERHHVAALVLEASPATWRSEAREADFYAAKGMLAGVLDSVGIAWRAEPGGRAFLHPGRSASVVAEGRPVGWIGELHPLVLREWDLDRAAAFELDADALAGLERGTVAYRDVTSFPAVFQDIAVVVPEHRTAAEIEGAVRAGGGELLCSTSVFDVYRGEQLDSGQKSLALRLEFRAGDRTLTDEEVAERRAAIETSLATLGGRLRA